jgi:hypothetical protein
MQKISTTLQFAKRRLPATKEYDTHWTPNTDLYATDAGVVIKVELAGLQRENLELTVDGHQFASAASGPTAAARPPASFRSWKSIMAPSKASSRCLKIAT